MAVKQVSKKDGRCWYFYTYIRDITGNKKRYKSKKYHTQKEAEKAE
ncbi:MAG: Arm DNA-binding domain-containing protein [Tenericutes bacterium]|nr:Arm DNA-binding domain-containing protein [Mycoplasmatota bacterium]